MLAVAVLPISHETLQYGSDDGGITVKADHPDLNKKMEVRRESPPLWPLSSSFSLSLVGSLQTSHFFLLGSGKED